MEIRARSVTGVLLAALALAACESAPPKPMETIEGTVEVSATVEEVDVLNRLLSLKTESGEQITVEVDPVVENLVQVRPGDKVVARTTYSATHTQTIRGIAPTGKSFRVRMTALFLFEGDGDGIVCERVYFDSATMLRQLTA